MAKPAKKTSRKLMEKFNTSSMPMNMNVKEEMMKQGKSAVAVTMPLAGSKYNKNTLLMAANLVQITLGDNEAIKIPSSAPSPSPPPSPSPLPMGGGLIASAGIGLPKMSSSKPSEPPTSNQKEETCTSIPCSSAISGMEEKLYEELTEETEKHILDVMNMGVCIDARGAIRKVMETIMSMIIVSRCTDKKKNIFDQDKAEEMLKRFVKDFSPSHESALDLLLELEELDKRASILSSRHCYFPIPPQPRKRQDKINDENITHSDFLESLESVKKCIADVEPNTAHRSKVYDTSVEFFHQNFRTLTKPLKEKVKIYGREKFELLKKVGQELKFGATHKIVTDMHIEMKSLADGKLNGFVFYPDNDVEKLKRRRGRPHLKSGARPIEDLVDGVGKFQIGEGTEGFDNIEELFEDIGSLATLYFSSYVPELGDEKQEKDLSEDYIECNISLVTKLVSVDDQVKKQLRAVYVHNKVKGVLQDYRSLLQDNGYLREEVEILRKRNEELEQRNKDLQEQLDDYLQRFEVKVEDMQTEGGNLSVGLEPEAPESRFFPRTKFISNTLHHTDC